MSTRLVFQNVPRTVKRLTQIQHRRLTVSQSAREIPRVPNPISPSLNYDNLKDHMQTTPVPLSVKELIDFAELAKRNPNDTELQSFNFLRRELPVRLANMIGELRSLPEQLRQQPSTGIIEGWYTASHLDIASFEDITTIDSTHLQNLNNTLHTIVNRHNTVVETMAHAVLEYQAMFKKDHPQRNNLDDQINQFLDRFFMSRISIRLLINQHLTIFHQQGSETHAIGTFYHSANIPDIVEQAYDSAKILCDHIYMDTPELEITLVNSTDDKSDKAFEITYIPSHLHHICFELFKNAQRATMELHGDSITSDPPKLQVQIGVGPTEITIKISDQGGGAPFSQSRNWFRYLYSTAEKPSGAPVEQGGAMVMAGYGVGLSISRLYARYLSGDLRIQSIEGYGTDVVIYLKRNSREAVEVLPNFVESISNDYKQAQSHPNQPDTWMGGADLMMQ